MSFIPPIFQRRGTAATPLQLSRTTAERTASPDPEPSPARSTTPVALSPLQQRSPAPAGGPAIFLPPTTLGPGGADSPVHAEPAAPVAHAPRVRVARPARRAASRPFTCPERDWPLLVAIADRGGSNRAYLQQVTGRSRYAVNDFIARLRQAGALLPPGGLPHFDANNASVQREIRRARASLRSRVEPAPLPSPLPVEVPPWPAQRLTVTLPRHLAPPDRPARALPAMDAYLVGRGIAPSDFGQAGRAMEFLAAQGRPARLFDDALALNAVDDLMQFLGHMPEPSQMVLCLPAHPAYLEIWRRPGGAWHAQALVGGGQARSPEPLTQTLSRLASLPALPEGAPRGPAGLVIVLD